MQVCRIIFFVIYFLVSRACAQGPSVKTNSDTFFIKKDTFHNGATKVYIIKNRNSKVYDRLPKIFGSYLGDTKPFNALDYIKHSDLPHPKKLIKHDLQGLPEKWFEMKYYKGSMYTYVSDINEIKQIQINQYAIKETFMDDCGAKWLVSVRKISATKYQVKSKIYGSNDTMTMNVYIIDPKNKVAVFEYINEEEKYRYRLMISADKIRSYPALVNINPAGRAGHFHSDKVPYERLIAESKH